MKSIKYILILLILVELFSPTIHVSAQTPPQGTCTYTSYQGRSQRPVKVTTTETQAACVARKPPGSWTTCTYTGRQGRTQVITLTAPNDTEAQCKARQGGTWVTTSNAAAPGADSTTTPAADPKVNTNYQLLAPLPGLDGSSIPNIPTDQGLGAYLNLLIKIFIGLCAVLSVVMIVVGGLEYMTSELSHTKEAGKERIEHAILGLLIALGAYALLFTINPDLLKSDIKIPSANSKSTSP